MHDEKLPNQPPQENAPKPSRKQEEGSLKPSAKQDEGASKPSARQDECASKPSARQDEGVSQFSTKGEEGTLELSNKREEGALKRLKSSSRRAFVLSLMALFLSAMWLSVSVYAWFIIKYPILSGGFNPGTLLPSLEVEYWDKNSGSSDKWVMVTDGAFFCDLGEINDITRLPDECNMYLKLKSIEASGIEYCYDIIIADLQILVYDTESGEQLSVEKMGTLSYYNATPSQKCFDYSLYLAAGDRLVPVGLEYGQLRQIESANHSLSGGSFVDEAQWLYIKLQPRLDELQNIFKSIPASYMPYTLVFLINFYAATRSI